jgi:hypothetical protein
MSKTHSFTDRLRLAWLSARYDFWLDLNSVPRRDRRELRNELLSNVHDAAADVGVRNATANIGKLRHLARQTARDGELRSAWSAAITASLTTVAALIVGFLFLSLYYVEGVLDSGTDQVVTSSLFPFFGSQIEVEPATADGLGFSVSPGALPLLTGVLVFIVVAKPWRALRRPTTDTPVNAH